MRGRALRAAALVLPLVIGASAHAQLGVLARLPLHRAIAQLSAPDASARREAAERLAFIGPHDAIAEPLRVALEHEAVPEVLSAMVTTLARRAEASDLSALEAAWERVSVGDRRAIVISLDAMGGEAALALLRTHLASEGASSRACAALTRTEERVRWLGSTLGDPAARDRVVSCLALAPASDARDEALLHAGLDLEPRAARDVLRALSGATTTRPEAVALAETALARADATLAPPALALLAHHAPERLPVERWQSWLDASDERYASALRALLVLAPANADAALGLAARGEPGAAARALEVLLERDDASDRARITAFASVDATRTRALDALADRDGGDAALAALPGADDVDLALALARPGPDARAALLARTRSTIVRALVSDVSGAGCAETDTSVAARRRAALCLVLTGAEALAARALETERDASVVGWLAIAARDVPVSAGTLGALLDQDDTRAAALALAPATLAAVTPHDRRALEARVVRGTWDPDDVVRAEAIRALGRIGRAVHRAVVLRALEDTAPGVRLAAARALAAVGVDGAGELRVVGRRHVETDAAVRAALDGASLDPAEAPLHVRVVEHDPALAGRARVTVWLADGRALRLAPVDGEVLVPGVPDAAAVVRLSTAPPSGQH